MAKYGNIEIEFEWDLAKEVENIRKHSVTFVEAVETFGDERGIQLVDISHSQHEERLYWVGKSKKGGVLTTRFTYRKGKSIIRIIGSAEWRRFKRIYDEAAKA